MIIRSLDEATCTTLLSGNRVARLAMAVDGQPYVVPLFYAWQAGHAFAFTMPGRKLDTMRANPKVALLVEVTGEGRAWKSVIAEGRFEELPDRIGFKRERDRAWSLLSEQAGWWQPGALKPVGSPLLYPTPQVFFRIAVERMSGREAVDTA